MTDLFSQWRTASSRTSSSGLNVQLASNQNVSSSSNTNNPSYDQVVEMIDHSLSSLKVYVLESDITETQNTVKSIVSQSTF